MAIALDLVVFEQSQFGLIGEDLVVGALFFRELVLLDRGEPVVKTGIELPLSPDAGRAVVVQLLIQLDSVVLVITGCRSRRPA